MPSPQDQTPDPHPTHGRPHPPHRPPADPAAATDALLATMEDLHQQILASQAGRLHEPTTPYPTEPAPIDLTRLPPDAWPDFESHPILIPPDLTPLLTGIPPDPYALRPHRRQPITTLLDNLELTLEARYGITAPWYIARDNDYPPITLRLCKEP